MSSVLNRATITAAVSGVQAASLDLGAGTFTFAASGTLTFTNGTGANQADKVFTDTRSLAASGTEDLDLAGVLIDAFGSIDTNVKVKCIFLKAADGNTNNVVISRPASNGFALFEAASDAIAVKPGGIFLWACPGTGIAVAAGTGDLLTITNSAAGTGVTYDIVIIGTSA